MTMICYQGERVGLDKGSPSLFSLGVSLGRQIRWCGHYNDARYYSILCHSLACAEYVPIRAALDALLHDTSEALMADVPTPMKTKTHRRREQILRANIYADLGLRWPVPDRVEEWVDEADDAMKGAEAYVLGHPGFEDFGYTLDPDAVKLVKKYVKLGDHLLNPEKAGKLFEKRFKKYRKEVGL